LVEPQQRLECLTSDFRFVAQPGFKAQQPNGLVPSHLFDREDRITKHAWIAFGESIGQMKHVSSRGISMH